MNKIKLWIAKFFLKQWGLEFSRTKNIKLPNTPDFEVVLFDGKHSLFTGKALPIVNVIIVESAFFKKYSKNVQNFLLAHEYAHTSVPLILDIITLALFFILGISSLNISAVIVLYFLWWLIKGGILLIPLLFLSILLALSLSIFGLLSWILEFHADWHAIKILGLKKAKKVYEEMLRKKEKTKFFARIVNRWTHPPMRLVLFLYEKIHKT